MTKTTEELCIAVAEKEGWIFDCEYDGEYLFHHEDPNEWMEAKCLEELCFRLIEKYKLDIIRELEQHDTWRVDWWPNENSVFKSAQDKDLARAIMLAVLAMGGD